MANGKIESKNQNILVENRAKVTITGVEQVESFNDNTIILTTVKGGHDYQRRKSPCWKIKYRRWKCENRGHY